MKDLEKNKDIGIYSRELKNTLTKLKEKETLYDEVQYFIRVVEDYFMENSPDKADYKVIVMGTSVPEEINLCQWSGTAAGRWLIC